MVVCLLSNFILGVSVIAACHCFFKLAGIQRLKGKGEFVRFGWFCRLAGLFNSFNRQGEYLAAVSFEKSGHALKDAFVPGAAALYTENTALRKSVRKLLVGVFEGKK